MNPRRFQLITFDLDDTLWDVRPVLERAETRVAQWMAQQCPEVMRRFSRNELVSLRLRLLQERPALRHDLSALRLEATRQALIESGYTHARAAILADEAFAVFIEARHDIECFPEVEACLEKLSGTYMLGALSNGNADIFRLQIGKYFRFAFSAAVLRSSKPEPAHFDAALDAARCGAERSIHVGDHHEHDMLGARRRGFTTVWFNPEDRAWPGDEPPSAQFARFGELPALIEALEQA